MNQRTVFVVYADKRKDLSKAEQYGTMKEVFSSLGKTYNPDALIEHARHVLDAAQEGDYLLVVGDPTLCGICMAVMLERLETVSVLRWDRYNLQYVPLLLDFSWE
jgi:hypothetical protein